VPILLLEENRSVITLSHDDRIKEIADRGLWLEDGKFKNMVKIAIVLACGTS
jgi:putative ABC transport system ATP-binding protein